MKVDVGGSHRETYHTKECRNYPENPREVELDQLADHYRKCKWCADSVNSDGEGMECPLCGEYVGKLPSHLPCDNE